MLPHARRSGRFLSRRDSPYIYPKCFYAITGFYKPAKRCVYRQYRKKGGSMCHPLPCPAPRSGLRTLRLGTKALHFALV